MKNRFSAIAKGAAITAGVAAAGYAGLVAWHRMRYGKGIRAAEPGQSSLLDRFIPLPEVIERHHIDVNAPADVTFAAAKELQVDSPFARAIFKMRELALGGTPDTRVHLTQLTAAMKSIGWVVLGEQPDREIVLGAVTQPWHANPVFRSVPSGEFESFREPGFVKIAFSLKAEPVGDRSVFHTETRVATTDPAARQQFRRYWSFVAPGVELIRLAMLRPLKREAERRAAKMAA